MGPDLPYAQIYVVVSNSDLPNQKGINMEPKKSLPEGGFYIFLAKSLSAQVHLV